MTSSRDCAASNGAAKAHVGDISLQGDGADPFPQDNLIVKPEDEVDTQASAIKLEYCLFLPEEIAKHRQDVSIKEVGVAFRDRSSLVGLTQIHQSKGLFKKVFWFIVLLLALVLLSYHTLSLVLIYMKFGTATDYHVESMRSMRFPAVTVCNTNMLVENDNSVIPDIRQTNRYADFLSEDDPQARGHQLQDLVVSASFDSKSLSNSDFDYFASPVFGNCFTFNRNNTYETRRSLPGYGLRMVLNVESYKYSRGISYAIPETVGAVIKVHPHFIEPIVEEKVLILSPGTSARLAVEKTEYHRIGGRYGHCRQVTSTEGIFYSGNYTRENCESSCLQRAVIERCCCYIVTMNREVDGTSWDRKCDGIEKLEKQEREEGNCGRCTFNRTHPFTGCSKEKEECMKKVWSMYDHGEIDCDHCYEECNEEVYDVRTNIASWPSDDYMTYELLPTLNESARLFSQLEMYLDSPFISTDIVKKNMLTVEVHYGSMATAKITTKPLIGDAEFIAQLEALAGFWIGWSMWTVFQFFEFLSDMVVLAIRKCRERRKAKQNETDDNEDV
ncbi:degenerin-like protein unc-105 isoform X2 [Watersipora subatra]|uniref:degenerin-like protein unc-105 isoform X2 n=1 Tax=Watersipora subatra TaxID=2589382 RepID=UPI00355B115E